MPTTRPVSYVKAHLAEVLDQVRESHGPITVTQNGSPSAVIVDHESYRRTQEALAILKLVAMGEKDVTAGLTIPHKQVFADSRAKILALIDGQHGNA